MRILSEKRKILYKSMIIATIPTKETDDYTFN